MSLIMEMTTNATSIFLRRDIPTKLLEEKKLVWYGKNNYFPGAISVLAAY